MTYRDSLEPENESLADIVLSAKLDPLRHTITALTAQIDQRRAMRDHSLKSLEERGIELESLVMHIGQGMRFDYMSFLTSRSRQMLERSISEIRREEARAHSDYFRDVSRLKEQLLYVLQKYERAGTMLNREPYQPKPKTIDVQPVRTMAPRIP